MNRSKAAGHLAIALVVLATSGGAVSAAEEIYRWVDAQGVVHYTQVAPRGVPFERVTPGQRPGGAPSFYNPSPDGASAASGGTPASSPSGSASPDPAPSSGGNPQGGTRLTEQQQAEQQRLQSEAEERLADIRAAKEENCRNAREQFQQFTTYARIRVDDGEGGTRLLTEEERQERIEEAQEAIVMNCDDAG
jgi:hypothetical protein